MITVPSIILFFAVRYALGRQSVAPSLVADAVRDNLKHLTEEELKAIVDETYAVRNLGMPCDVSVWESLRRDINEHLERSKVMPDCKGCIYDTQLMETLYEYCYDCCRFFSEGTVEHIKFKDLYTTEWAK